MLYASKRRSYRPPHPPGPQPVAVVRQIIARRARLFLAGCGWDRNGSRVHQTGGIRSGLTSYRSNRSGPVSVWAGTKPTQIQNLNLNSKNEKFLKKF